MPDSLQTPPKIVILDDDHYPDGRITKKLIPEFEKRGLENLVVHFKTFEEYQEYLDNKDNLNKIGLIVLDCALEGGKHYYSFEQTLPWTFDTLNYHNHSELINCIMPASGNLREGVYNNRYALDYFDRRGYVTDWQQESLTSGGLSSNPEKICNKILGFYETKYPNMLSLEGARKAKESEVQNPNFEAESPYWKSVLEERNPEINGLTSTHEDAVHRSISEKTFEESQLDRH